MNSEKKNKIKDRFDRAIDIFQDNFGLMRTNKAIEAGIHPSTLYSLCSKGTIEHISRGLYRIVNGPSLSNPDFVTVSMKIPAGIICLISALSFYELTLQIPHEVYVALPKGSEQPKLEYPPVRIFRFSGESFNQGVEIVCMDNIPVKIYCIEKTIADAFKFRNKIGNDTAIEALRAYMEMPNKNIDKLLHYSEICRIIKIIRPYIEACI